MVESVCCINRYRETLMGSPFLSGVNLQEYQRADTRVAELRGYLPEVGST